MGLSIGQRTTILQQKLLNIRVGAGAVRLPHNVKRLNLRFAQKAEGGHLGARKLWRNELIRLKYHNPAVPITIDRTAQQTDQALLAIHLAPQDAPQTSSSETSSPAAIDSTTASSTPSDAAGAIRVQTIDVTGKMSNEIMAALIEATNAIQLEPTPEDRSLSLDLEAQERRNAAARVLSAQVRAKAKREQDLLQQARGELGLGAT